MSAQPQELTLARIIFLGMALLAFAGAFCEITIGEHFIYANADRYRELLPTLASLALPLAVISWILADLGGAIPKRAAQSTWRRLGVQGIGLALMVSAMVTAPLGYSALAGMLFAGTPYVTKGVMVEISARKTSGKHCRHTGVLQLQENQAQLCIQQLLTGPAPKAGDTVEVLAQSSRYGHAIKEIRAMAPGHALLTRSTPLDLK